MNRSFAKRVLVTSLITLFFVVATTLLAATYNTEKIAAVVQSSQYFSQADIDENISKIKDAFNNMDEYAKNIALDDETMKVKDADAYADNISKKLDEYGINDENGKSLSKNDILGKDTDTDAAIIKSLHDTSDKISKCLSSRYFTEQSNNASVIDTKNFLIEQKKNIDRLAVIQPSISSGTLDLLTRSDIAILRSYYGDVAADILEQQMNMKDFNVPTDQNYDYADMPFSDDGTPEISGVTWINCGGYVGSIRLMWKTPNGQSGGYDSVGGKKPLAQISSVDFQQLNIPEGSKIQYGVNVKAGKDSKWSDVFSVTHSKDSAVGFQTSGTVFKSPSVNTLLAGTKSQVHDSLKDKSKSLIKMIGLIIGAILLAIATAIASALTFGALAPAAAMSNAAMAAIIGTVAGTIALGASTAITIATADVNIENVELETINKSRHFYNEEKEKFGIYGFEYVSTGYYSSCPEVHFKSADGREHSKKANDGHWIRLGKASGNISLPAFTASDGVKISDGDEVWLVPKVQSGSDRQTSEHFIYDSKSTDLAGYVSQGQTHSGDMKNHLVGFGGPKTVEGAMDKYVNSSKWEFISMMISVAAEVLTIALEAIGEIIEGVSEILKEVGEVLAAAAKTLDYLGKAFEFADYAIDFKIENPAEGSKAFEIAMQEKVQTMGILDNEQSAIEDSLLPKANFQVSQICDLLTKAAADRFPPTDPDSPNYDFVNLFFSDDQNLPASIADEYKGMGLVSIGGKNYLSLTQYAVILNISPNDTLITTALDLRPSYINAINLVAALQKRLDTIGDEIFVLNNSSLSGYFSADMAFSNLLKISNTFKDTTLNSYVGNSIFNVTGLIYSDKDFDASAILPKDNATADNILISSIFGPNISSIDEKTYIELKAAVNGTDYLIKTKAFLDTLTDEENEILYEYLVELLINKGELPAKDPVSEQLFAQYLISVPNTENLIYIASEDASWYSSIAKYLKEKLKNAGGSINKTLFSTIYLELMTTIIEKAIPTALTKAIKLSLDDSLYYSGKNILDTFKREAIDATKNSFVYSKRAYAEVVSAINIERKILDETENQDEMVTTHIKGGLYRLIYDANKLAKQETYYIDKQNLTFIRDYAMYVLNLVVRQGDDGTKPDESKIFPDSIFQRLADILDGINDYEQRSINLKVENVTPDAIKSNTKDAKITVSVEANPETRAPQARFLMSTMTGDFKLVKSASSGAMKKYYFEANLKQLPKSGDNNVLISYSGDSNYNSKDLTYTVKVAKADSRILVSLAKNAKIGNSEIVYSISVIADQIVPSGKIQYSLNNEKTFEAIIPSYSASGLDKVSFEVKIDDKFTAGEQTLKVSYLGDDSVNPSSTVFKSTVEKGDTYFSDITYRNPIVTSDDDVTISGRINVEADVDMTGDIKVNFFQKEIVDIKITSKAMIDPNKTVTTSYISFSTTIDLNKLDIKAGDYPITISYTGDINLKPCVVNETETVIKENSKIVIDPPDNPTIDSDSLDFGINVDSTKHIVNGRVTMTLSGPAVYGAPVVKNIMLNGRSTDEALSFSADKEIYPGEYTLSVDYVGNDYIKEALGGAKIMVLHDDSSVVLDDVDELLHNNIKGITISGAILSTSKYKPTGEIFASLTAVDSFGSRSTVSGPSLTANESLTTMSDNFKAGFNKVVRGIIDEDSKFQIFVPDDSIRGGEYMATIYYAGDVNFNPSINSVVADVQGTYVNFNYRLKKPDDLYRTEVTYNDVISLPAKRTNPKGYRFAGWYYDTDDGPRPFDFAKRIVKKDLTLNAIYKPLHPRFVGTVDKMNGTSTEVTLFGSHFAPYEKLVFEFNTDADVLLHFRATKYGNFKKIIKFSNYGNYGENSLIVKTDVNNYGTEEVSESVNIFIQNEDAVNKNNKFNVDKVADHKATTTSDENSDKFLVVKKEKEKNLIADIIELFDKNGITVLIVMLAMIAIAIACVVIIRIRRKI